MTVGEAKNIARQWVEEQKSRIDDFYGAYFSGSFNFKADDDIWEDWSDIDIRIVIDGDPPAGIIHKRLLHRNLLFDAWYDRLAEWLKPDRLLSNSGMAYHFSVPNIIDDPTGNLTKTQKAVAKEYAKIEWVRKRCDHALAKSKRTLELSVGEQQKKCDFFTKHVWHLGLGAAWATGIPVLADLSAPTGRRCMIVFRDVLKKYNIPRLHPLLLELLGHPRVNHGQTISMLNELAKAYDQAVQLVPQEIKGSTYISEMCRPYAIGGSQQMIDDGNFREAFGFILWMFSLAHQAIQNHGSDEEKVRSMQSYMKTMRVWGYASEDDIIQREKKVKELLPEIMKAAEYIIANNPIIIK